MKMTKLKMIARIFLVSVCVAMTALAVAQDQPELVQVTYEDQDNTEEDRLTVYEIKQLNITNSIEVRRGVGKLTDHYNSPDVEDVFEDGELGARTTLRSWRLN